jgi:bifunctional non-homologous end joining protein LigD
MNPSKESTETPETTTLYYKEGNSDKIYQCAIEAKEGGFVVTFAYGRRGSTLQTGNKIQNPVPYEAAFNLYNKLVKEKLAKGYTPGANGTPYRQTENETRATGILPQLLNPIEDSQLDAFINDPAFCMQEKFDGRRVLIQKLGDKCSGINRKGLTIGLPETIIASARNIAGDFIIDGESIADHFYAFDILMLNGEDLRPLPYVQRWESLCHLINSNCADSIYWVDTAFSLECKRAMFEILSEAEGVVFKRILSPYTPGRPSTGGDQFKLKFHATLSAVVAVINDKRSVEIRLFDDQQGWVLAGNVAIPANLTIPQIGAVVEIKYLYAFKQSGCLFQPIYLGLRGDIDREECTVDQLKFKSEEKDFIPSIQPNNERLAFHQQP